MTGGANAIRTPCSVVCTREENSGHAGRAHGNAAATTAATTAAMDVGLDQKDHGVQQSLEQKSREQQFLEHPSRVVPSPEPMPRESQARAPQPTSGNPTSGNIDVSPSSQASETLTAGAQAGSGLPSEARATGPNASESMPFAPGAAELTQIGRLARRDLARALQQLHHFSPEDPTRLLDVLEAAPPQDWSADLLLVFRWYCTQLTRRHRPARGDESADPTTPDIPAVPDSSAQEALAGIFSPERMSTSPMVFTRRHMVPGDELSELLARRLGSSLVLLAGEGDRLIVLDETTLIVGTHLGYIASSRQAIRARRVTAAEQQVISQAHTTRERVREQLTGAPESLHLLELRFERLLTHPNVNLRATLERLHSVPPVQRQLLWRACVEFQRRQTLPLERRPLVSTLLETLHAQGIMLEATHVGRLLGLVASLVARIQPDPQVATDGVQLSLGELNEYLSWEIKVTHLPVFRSVEGVLWLNEALLYLQQDGTLPPALWPAGLADELVEMRETYLKRIHEKSLGILHNLEPLSLLSEQLNTHAELLWPAPGDLPALLLAWKSLHSSLQDLLAGQPRSWETLEPKMAAPPPAVPQSAPLQGLETSLRTAPGQELPGRELSARDKTSRDRTGREPGGRGEKKTSRGQRARVVAAPPPVVESENFSAGPELSPPIPPGVHTPGQALSMMELPWDDAQDVPFMSASSTKMSSSLALTSPVAPMQTPPEPEMTPMQVASHAPFGAVEGALEKQAADASLPSVAAQLPVEDAEELESNDLDTISVVIRPEGIEEAPLEAAGTHTSDREPRTWEPNAAVLAVGRGATGVMPDTHDKSDQHLPFVRTPPAAWASPSSELYEDDEEDEERSVVVFLSDSELEEVESSERGRGPQVGQPPAVMTEHVSYVTPPPFAPEFAREAPEEEESLQVVAMPDGDDELEPLLAGEDSVANEQNLADDSDVSPAPTAEATLEALLLAKEDELEASPVGSESPVEAEPSENPLPPAPELLLYAEVPDPEALVREGGEAPTKDALEQALYRPNSAAVAATALAEALEAAFQQDQHQQDNILQDHHLQDNILQDHNPEESQSITSEAPEAAEQNTPDLHTGEAQAAPVHALDAPARLMLEVALSEAPAEDLPTDHSAAMSAVVLDLEATPPDTHSEHDAETMDASDEDGTATGDGETGEISDPEAEATDGNVDEDDNYDSGEIFALGADEEPPASEDMIESIPMPEGGEQAASAVDAEDTLDGHSVPMPDEAEFEEGDDRSGSWTISHSLLDPEDDAGQGVAEQELDRVMAALEYAEGEAGDPDPEGDQAQSDETEPLNGQDDTSPQSWFRAPSSLLPTALAASSYVAQLEVQRAEEEAGGDPDALPQDVLDAELESLQPEEKALRLLDEAELALETPPVPVAPPLPPAPTPFLRLVPPPAVADDEWETPRES